MSSWSEDYNTVDTMFTAIDLLPFEDLWLEEGLASYMY